MPYPGGKSGSGTYQRIICQIPPHQVYIEAFLGGAAIMSLKKPANLNIGIDLVDGEKLLLNWVAAETVTPAATPLSGLVDVILASGNNAESGGARRRMTPQKARAAGNAGYGANAGARILTSKTASVDPTNRYSSPHAETGVVRSRWEFHRADAIEWLSKYKFTGAEMVYCDPPYMHETRGRTRRYEYEMTDAQHRALLEVLRTIPCPVMISGYWTRLYDRTLKGWRAMNFQAVNRAGTMATEWLWMNYPEPVALHDYSYVGEGHRERWRITKRRRRWVERLKRMPLMESRALLAAIEEAGFGSPEPLSPGLPSGSL